METGVQVKRRSEVVAIHTDSKGNSRVQLPALVMLETWPRESSPPLRNFFDKLMCFLLLPNYHASFVNTDNSLIVYRTSTLACHAFMLETWLWESGVRRLRKFLISSGNFYRVITLPFPTLTTPW